MNKKYQVVDGRGVKKIILGHNNCNKIVYNNYFQNVIKYNTLLIFHNKERIRRHELGAKYFQFGGLFSQTNNDQRTIFGW